MSKVTPIIPVTGGADSQRHVSCDHPTVLHDVLGGELRASPSYGPVASAASVPSGVEASPRTCPTCSEDLTSCEDGCCACPDNVCERGAPNFDGFNDNVDLAEVRMLVAPKCRACGDALEEREQHSLFHSFCEQYESRLAQVSR